MTEPPTWGDTAGRAAAKSIAAVPLVGATLQVIVEDVLARRRAAAGATVDMIIETVGEDALAERVATDPVTEALFVNAVEAALRTGMQSKRRLLARAVADAVIDEAVLDESVLLADVLAELDVPHVRALKRMADEWRVIESLPDAAERTGDWGMSAVWKTLPEPLQARLIRTGTGKATPNTMFTRAEPHRVDGITDYGLNVIAELETEGLSEDL